MKIDLTCPIEIRGYELYHDERGCTRASIRLNNLASHPIARFDAIACWSNSLTGQTEAKSFRADRLNADARAEFDFSFATVEVPEADVLELHFNRVRFSDGTADWIGGQTELVEIDELPLLSDDEMDALCDIAGEDAVRFPESDDKHWICVCGRMNYRHQTECIRCRRDRSDVLHRMDRKSLLSEAADKLILPDDLNAPLTRSLQLELREKLRSFRYQREILMRRTITMSVVIAMLLGFSVVSDYFQRVEAAQRGAIPPTLSVSADQP